MNLFKPILTSIFLTCIQKNIIAQQTDKDSSRQMEDVIVSPFSIRTKYPVTSSTLNRRELLIKNYGQEPSFILSQTPSVTMYSDAGSGNGYSYFRIRGIDQTRVNMSLNGVPLNEPEDQGVYFSNYPDFLESVSSIQIQRGSGYSRNGVASYGGSIMFESLLFKDSSAGQFNISAGSYNTSRINASINTGLKKNIGAYIRSSYLTSDGYKEHSGNNAKSVFVNTGYWGKKHQVYLVSFAGNQKNQLAWVGAAMDSIKHNPKFNANKKTEKDVFLQLHLQVHHNWKLNTTNQLHNGVFFNFLNGNYDFDLNNFLGLPSTAELYNYAFRSHFAGIFSYHSLTAKKIKWYNGIQSNWYIRQHTGSEAAAGWLYTNNGFRNESSFFTKLLYQFPKLTILGDVQYRYSSFTYKGDEKMPGQYWNFINTTAGVSYQINPSLNLYYSAGIIHREPTRSDLFMGNDNLSRDINGNLLFAFIKPEKAIDNECGIKWISKRNYLFSNVYYMRFTNEITLNGQIGPTGVPLHSNAAKSFRSGWELEAGISLSSKFHFKHTSTIAHNRIKEKGINIQPVLSPTFLTREEISFTENKFQFSASFCYQGKSYIDYANTTLLPAFQVINFNANYFYKKHSLFVVINNITNEKYFTNGLFTATGTPGYFIQAPINIYGGIKLRWK